MSSPESGPTRPDNENPKPTHYETLGLRSNATPEDISNSFRLLSKTMHPDTGGDPERYKRITEAYNVLKDPVRHLEYRRHLGLAIDTSALTPAELESRIRNRLIHSSLPEELVRLLLDLDPELRRYAISNHDLLNLPEHAIVNKFTHRPNHGP